MKTDLEKLEELKKAVARLVSSQKRFDQLSNRRRDMSMDTHTQSAIGKANANLDWHAMEHDKLLREVHAICVDCKLADPKDDYSAIEYNPSPFHRYAHQPRIPECRA